MRLKIPDAVSLEAKLTAIFKPFVQATGRRGGTGLGLAISASLAEAMGGTLNRHQYASCWQLFSLTTAGSPPQTRKQKCVQGTDKS
ncbi:hybrid sensory histidine kinase TorS [Salmonella enterica subsp. enterica]|uniref:histidine kinase n=1 Tax=Salmonella enterica I TaxID=59201 RepID=A0A447TRR4_SALET|nr:hybrid sensory histidine kinase TorS [Salmonella enterica subsp. enterica]